MSERGNAHNTGTDVKRFPSSKGDSSALRYAGPVRASYAALSFTRPAGRQGSTSRLMALSLTGLHALDPAFSLVVAPLLRCDAFPRLCLLLDPAAEQTFGHCGVQRKQRPVEWGHVDGSGDVSRIISSPISPAADWS